MPVNTRPCARVSSKSSTQQGVCETELVQDIVDTLWRKQRVALAEQSEFQSQLALRVHDYGHSTEHIEQSATLFESTQKTLHLAEGASDYLGPSTATCLRTRPPTNR